MWKSVFTRSWLKWLVVFALWTVIGLAFAGQLYLTQSQLGRPVTWRFAVGRALADWYGFAILSVPALWLAGRFRLEQGAWRRALAVHALASGVFSLLWMVLRAGLERWTDLDAPQAASFFAILNQVLVKTFFFNLLIYWVIVSVSHAINYYLRLQEREVRAADLERRLAQARLQALQMQLNPHFLFNTLHAVSSLMHRDVEAADRMIARLSDLLRAALDSSNTQEVPLRQEVEFLRHYLDIEQTRFGERLSVQLDIAPDTLEAQVPNLILQPLLENAIRHGIEPHARPGRINLRVLRENGSLRLQVTDNGNGLAGPIQENIGLSNTRARLQQLYGAAQKLELANGPDGGLIVDLVLPFHTAAHDSRPTASTLQS